MHLEIKKIDKIILNKSEKYLIDKNKNKFSTISHKNDLVFIGTNNKKIGVDVELFKIRDENLLDKFSQDEYDILGGKNWNNFYILWTSKESIIKYDLGSLDDMGKIKLINFNEENKLLSKILFSYKLCFEFNGKLFHTFNGKGKKVYFSICY